MNSSTKIALVITLLDAMGIYFIMPVLPTLLREFIASEDIANHFGVLLALYALMQVIFAPWLGKMSDRFGRRPVLLLSLIGASLDYLLLAFSSALWMLYLGRLLSGITGATGAVAASVIADTTSASQRVKWFGLVRGKFWAWFNSGVLIIGGFAGEISPHSPFFIAALLNIVTFLVVMFWFRETKNTRDNTDTEVGVETQSNSVYITLFKTMPILLIIYFSAQLIYQIPATVWVLFTENRFGWNSMMVGFSLAGLGLLHSVFQAFVAGRIATKWGEKTAVLLGFIADSSAFAFLAFISEGFWLVFPVLILLAGGGIALPALQGVMSIQTKSHQQGALQGLLVSLNNATGVITITVCCYL